jgi:hypothetical protein
MVTSVGRNGQWQRYLAQVLYVKPQIHACTFRAAVPKNIADVLQRNAFAQKPYGV